MPEFSNELKFMNRCAVSTSWRSEGAKHAKELLEAMQETGFSTLELEFRIRPEILEDIKKRREEWGVRILSLHAPCPVSWIDGKKTAEYLISDKDEENRKRGVGRVKETLRNAVELDAGAVVLHCGRVDMDEPIHRMMEFYNQGALASDPAMAFLREASIARSKASEKCLPSLLKSLEEINEEAVRLGVWVGLENRYYFREMPDREELDIILERFEGGNLWYWHDTGHAHAREVLFGLPQREMLETFSDRLLGVHLHDAVGYTDHDEPGKGDIDFLMVKEFLGPRTLRVMELRPSVELEGARRGIAFLREKGIFDTLES